MSSFRTAQQQCLKYCLQIEISCRSVSSGIFIIKFFDRSVFLFVHVFWNQLIGLKKDINGKDNIGHERQFKDISILKY